MQSDLMPSLPLSPQYRTATSFLQTLCSDLYTRQATSSGEAQSLCRHTVAFKASLEICVGRLWNIKTILYSFLLSQQQTPLNLSITSLFSLFWVAELAFWLLKKMHKYISCTTHANENNRKQALCAFQKDRPLPEH